MRIVAEGWGWRHAGRAEWAVRDLDLTIADGERVLLLGASGAGKSTLMHALAGVLGGAEEGEEAGRLTVDGVHPSRLRGHVGLVMQDPDSQVVLAQVGDDVAFGCENLGMDPDEIWPRVRAALDAVMLPVALDRSTSELSGGQKQRLTIAGALAMQAGALLLHEPTANLDPQGVDEVRRAVDAVVRDRGTTLLVVEHRVDVWLDLVDRVIILAADGGLLADGTPDEVFTTHRDALLAAGVWVPGVPLPTELALPGADARGAPLPPAPAGTPRDLLTTHDLAIGHHAGDPVREHLEVTIPAGTSTMVTGPNGAGKSTLALTLAGLLPPLEGRVVADPSLHPPTQAGRGRLRRRRSIDVTDPASWASRDLITRIGTVFQQPEHQFVAATVREELAIGLKALARTDASLDDAEIALRTDELLESLHLIGLAGANPFTLSGGEKRRLSVGTVLATAPRVIFLDEPTFGQDRNTWLDMVALVRTMVAEGCAVVSVTHDADFIALLGQHHIHLEGSHG